MERAINSFIECFRELAVFVEQITFLHVTPNLTMLDTKADKILIPSLSPTVIPTVIPLQKFLIWELFYFDIFFFRNICILIIMTLW